MSADTNLMPIPGPVDPVPVPRAMIPRADGKVELPAFGLFRAGTGQVYEGPNNARRFTGTHPGRGDCRMGYDLLRLR